MTKLKSKKMSKSTFAVIIMAIAMVALLAFSGSFAYFTAVANGVDSTDSVTTGTVKLSSAGASLSFGSSGDIVPGAKLFATAPEITLVNYSDVKTYVFVDLTTTLFEPAIEEDGEDTPIKILVDTGAQTNRYKPVVLIDLVEGQETTWQALPGYDGVYYLIVDGVSSESENIDKFSFTATFNSAIDSEVAETIGDFAEEHNIVVDDSDEDEPTYPGYEGSIMGVGISISLNFSSIQYEGDFTGSDGARAADAYSKL